MADDYVALGADGLGKKVDCSKLTTASGDVERQRLSVGDDTDPAAFAKVTNTKPAANAYAMAVRPIPGDPLLVALDTTHANPLSEIPINFNGLGLTPLINGLANKTIKVWKIWFQVNGNVSLTPKTGNTVFSGPMDLEQGGGQVLPRDSDPWFTCGVGEAFGFDLNSAVQVSGRAYYTQD